MLKRPLKSSRVSAAVAVLVLSGLSGCEFDRGAIKPTSQLDMSPIADAGHSSTPLSMDSGTAQYSPMDAAQSMPAIDAGSDAGLGDGGAMQPGQNGGLQCGTVFCPFAQKPIEPCCTTQADVKTGVARAENRCGLQFDATGSDFFGEQCWQRDQPGVTDNSCPGVSVDLRSKDPGCCTDQGVCGGVDTEHGLGCHLDPEAKVQACGSMSDADAGEPSCDVRGVYAVRLQVDLAWGGQSGGLADLTDDGRGPLVVQMLTSFDSVDPSTLEVHGKMRTCSVELPTFYSTTLCEAYQPIFPNAMWDSAAMPSFKIDGHLQCLEPGCIAGIDAQTVLLGIALDNPESPWPTASQTANITCKAGKGSKCFPDHDNDGRPGLTVPLSTTGVSTAGKGCNRSYTNKGAPLSASLAAIFDGVRRADRTLLGVRMKIGSSFRWGERCESGHGSGIAEFVNSRGQGCLVQPGTVNFGNGFPAGPNEACTADEAAFMDQNLPIYDVLKVGKPPDSKLVLPDTSPSLGPLVRVARLGDKGAAVTCEDVRNAVYP